MSVIEPKSFWFSKLPASLLLGMALFFSMRLLAAELPVKQEPQAESVPASAPVPAPALAPEPVPAPVVDQVDAPFAVIDTPRNYLSAQFVRLAANIDRFFGDDRNYQESNESVVQLDLTKLSGYGGDRKIELYARANLRLPNTEHKLHLLLETDPEKNLSSEKKKSQPVVRTKVVTPSSVGVAARFEKMREDRWRYSTDAGVQFRGLTTKPNPFMRGRVSYTLPMGQWRMKAVETLFWFNTIGAGETTQLDFEHIISEPLLFRASSNATWLHAGQNFDLRQDMSVYHTLSERTALLYQASAIGVSQPQLQVMDYVALVVYRYRMHRDWMFFELSPQLHFPKEMNYRSNPALSMRLEVLFDDSR